MAGKDKKSVLVVTMSEEKPKLCRFGFVMGGAKQSEATDFRCSAYSPAPEETPAARESWSALLRNWESTSEAKVNVVF